MEETENNAEATLDEEAELLNDPIEEIKIDKEVILEGQQKAILTQVTDENDGYYEQYTIYPLYEKKANKTSTALYQMLKIQDLPLDNPAEYLDAMSKERVLVLMGQKSVTHDSIAKKPRNGQIIRRRLRQRNMEYVLGTWNVRTLNKSEVQTALQYEIQKYKVTITAVQKIRWLGDGTRDTESHTILYSGKKQGTQECGEQELLTLGARTSDVRSKNF
ncbi:craniofacial development protein 2-like protein [Lasius niger]|uniref:Craniofacial development protein 2-like protein n=1 Tax=Lasius niger TaxID=67767 RepID=A0A0J7KBP3_LASNI|nr:craniofacial development protein 2-like protein [Lasius niger]